ncbi:MAG TPA: DUF222 domain-containing protein, partial [Polyangiales bacterium]|nr:DUF222 domain-containing protein [Polyangiales bacterium]
MAAGKRWRRGSRKYICITKCWCVRYDSVMQDDASTLSDEAVERELTTLMGHLNAGNYRFLVLLAEFERRGGHVGIGLASCAHWLSWRCGIGLVAAREKVRVARALEGLPRVADAMRRGVLSYCKVRALTRIATAENEAMLLSIAEAGTVSHVEKVVRLYRRAERQELHEANERFAERYLQCYVDEVGDVVIRGRLPAELGAAFMKALEAATDVMREMARDSREAPDAARDAHAACRADALGLIAECSLTHGATDVAGADRQVVTIHVEEAVLRDETAQGRCELEEQTSVHPATARRFACDASSIEITENANGEPLKLGRKSRTVSTALRRALVARDRGCCFPGCTNQRFMDAHHIQHWVDGGRTDLDNLALVCRRHHRFLHEYGYSVVRRDGALEFRRADGRLVPQVPPAVETERGCERLQQAHEQGGLAIRHDTADSHWGGEVMDYNWAL